MTPEDLASGRRTVCPGCGAQFRIGAAELAQAAGQARCGRCLLVFDATAEAALDADLVDADDASMDHVASVAQSVVAGAATDSDAAAEEHDPAAAAVDPPASKSADDLMAPGLDADQMAALASLDTDVAPPPEDREPTFSRLRLALAGILAVVLAIALLAQVAWLFREPGLGDPVWRDRYVRVAAVVGWEVPPFEDLARIRATRVQVVPHPDQEGVLRVYGVLVNEAPLPQAYPTLLLTFTDHANQPVASGRFGAGDYLGGEMLGVRDMQPGSAVQLVIEILNPGAVASGYRLEMRSANRRSAPGLAR